MFAESNTDKRIKNALPPLAHMSKREMCPSCPCACVCTPTALCHGAETEGGWYRHDSGTGAPGTGEAPGGRTRCRENEIHAVRMLTKTDDVTAFIIHFFSFGEETAFPGVYEGL